MERGSVEWGERHFGIRIWCEAGEIRGVVRNLATGERTAFASRQSFMRQMMLLFDATAAAPPASSRDPEPKPEPPSLP